MLNEGPKAPKPDEFVDSVAQSDGYELAAAQTALAQSRNPQVRAFAERMMADHERMSQDLRDAAVAAGLKPPQPRVGGDQAWFLAALQSLRGAPFDREYGRQQMLAHTSTLTVMRSYADKGTDPSLRRMAASSVPIVERHLQTARQLHQSLM